MPAPSIIESLPTAIKAALFEKVLSTPGQCVAISQWMLDTYSIKISKTTIARFGKKLRSVFGGLIDLGYTPSWLAAKAEKLESLGGYLVQQRFIERRIAALDKEIFEDETEVAP